MMEFLLQFLAQAWRLVAFIVVMIILAIFVSWRNGQQAKKARAEKKARMDPNLDQKRQQAQEKKKSTTSKRRSQAKSTPQQSEPDQDEMLFAPAAEGSIFDDDELFPDAGDEDFDDLVTELEDDPLAELYAARAEAHREQPQIVDDDEEVVDLASLLSGMAEEPKDYHRVLETPVAVKLITKQKSIARELLTIMRDERDSRLMVQIGDVAYRTLQEDKVAKKQFATIMQELSGLIHKPDPNPPADADISGYDPNQMVPQPIDVHVSNGGETQAREMISILRDEADGHLIIQIGNTGYRTLVGQDKAKNGFAKIMKELSQSVTVPDDNPPEVKVAPPPRKKKSANESLPPLPKFGEAVLGMDLKDEVLPGDIRMPKMDEMPDAYEVGRFGRVKVKKLSDQEKVDPVNIAEAIEEYLQYKISITPQFQNRGIHIRTGFGGGVRIDVDGASYDFVDEVTDKDAQAFIKQAIDEWQERH